MSDSTNHVAAMDATPLGPPNWVSAALIVVGIAAVAAGLAVVPAEKILGTSTRLVFLHGAITWTGLVMTIIASIGGFVFLVRSLRGRDGEENGGGGYRTRRFLSLAVVFWVISLGLSFPVMYMTWGGVLWREPKLHMSVYIVSTLLVVWAIGLFVEREAWTAIGALIGAGVMVFLIAITPGAFHPENPIFGSDNLRFIGSFFALLGGLVALASGVALSNIGIGRGGDKGE